MKTDISKPKLLIVDDVEVNLRLLSEALENIPITIQKANCGLEAIEYVQNNDYFLILMDVSMPGMDGFTATSKILDIKAIPVIFITAHATQEKNIEQGYKSGGVDYLFKPVNLSILTNKVEIFLEIYNQKKIIENISIDLKDKNAALLFEMKQRTKAVSKLKMLSNIVEQTPNSILITDEIGVIKYVNDAFCKTTGYRKNEMVGKKSTIINPKNLKTEKPAMLWETLQSGKTWRGEFQNTKKNGEHYWEQMVITPLLDEQIQITHFASMQQDISLKKEYEQKLLEQAHFDFLTGLPNRKLFLERCEDTLKYAKIHKKGFAIMYLDLDGFKAINDSYGHHEGDNVLVECARRLNSCLKESDTVSRIGGDEFCILLTDIQKENSINNIITKILESFRAPFIIKEQVLKITISVGISLYPTYDKSDKKGMCINSIIHSADLAMYKSKKEGKNTYNFYTKKMDIDSKRKKAIEQALEIAITNQKLTVSFQPIFNANDFSVYSLEALVRWEDSKLGHISPMEFIPIAEQTGLILHLTEFVISRSILMIQEIDTQFNLDINIAINISPSVFRNGNALKKIIKDIQNTNAFDLKKIELEITENVLLEDNPDTHSRINFYKDLGIKLVMDDFGTGYSSLAYLNKFPFDILKIDRSFIMNLETQEKSKIIVKSILATAHNLDMKIIAEGVETKEQLDFLKNLNCDKIQGYLLAKPMNGTLLKEFFTKRA